MNRVFLTLVVLVASLAAQAARPRLPSRPNIVFVITDDQGYGDLGVTGNPIVKTPHLERLASESSQLTDYHVAPTCSPLFADAASDYVANVARGVETLVVIPFWEEIEQFNLSARQALRQQGLLGTAEVVREAVKPLTWTEEQKQHWDQYRSISAGCRAIHWLRSGSQVAFANTACTCNCGSRSRLASWRKTAPTTLRVSR